MSHDAGLPVNEIEEMSLNSFVWRHLVILLIENLILILFYYLNVIYLLIVLLNVFIDIFDEISCHQHVNTVWVGMPGGSSSCVFHHRPGHRLIC